MKLEIGNWKLDWKLDCVKSDILNFLQRPKPNHYPLLIQPKNEILVKTLNTYTNFGFNIQNVGASEHLSFHFIKPNELKIFIIFIKSYIKKYFFMMHATIGCSRLFGYRIEVCRNSFSPYKFRI